ncbi:MAG: DUF5067 domain-containing protein [Coriobacteriia bacterium]|nr:DUF5067 domain-containing protein [Coriobacteriia bacterium]MCL2750658.1 DUF5067 domain-containing protein [Coriobacteriia bacterium]
MKIISFKKQSVKKVFSGLLVAVLLVALTGCQPVVQTTVEDEKSQDRPEVSVVERPDTKEDDVIVAGTVDTSSEFKFEVRGAFIGAENYSDDPVVILVAEFTNLSDKNISYGFALDSTAFQGGHELRSAYLGIGTNTYEDIEPGVTTSILIAWKMQSITDSVEITVVDSRHYAKEVLFKETYTIEQLIKNTLEFIDEFDVAS